jgi:hypothetical protein
MNMGCCKNVGSIDRGIRALIGVIALVLAFATLGVMDGALWGIVAAVVGVVMLGTAAVGMCPLYVPFRLSTCRAGTK